MESIKEVLMNRDGMSEDEVIDLISDAQDDFNYRVARGDLDAAENICADWFGLEPDYLIEFF